MGNWSARLVDRLRAVGWGGCFLVLLAWGATPASADRWYVHYDRAEQALAGEDWALAIEELNEALGRRGDSGARVRSYGMNLVDYFPYLKLGIAYYELGQFDAALQAFETEERLAAIAGASDAEQQLSEFRRRTLDAKEEQSAATAQRTDEIVRDELASARTFEEAGRSADAMNALGRVLAVEPENSEAKEVMERLRQAAAAAEERQRRRQTATTLVAAARGSMESGDLQQAAVQLRQALELEPSEEAQGLMRQVQTSIRASVEAADRTARANAALEEAQSLATTGAVREALDRLELALALSPEEPAALALRERLLERRAKEEQESELVGRLAEAEGQLAAGRPEEALAVANLLLARAPGNTDLLNLVRRAYVAVSRQLLGSASRENLPPAIRFADLRVVDAEGGSSQPVTESAFRLTGVVIDRTEVSLEASTDDGRPLEVRQNSQLIGDEMLTEFSISHHLAPGGTTIRVQATDEAGLSSSSEYQVIYHRPWHRSPTLGLLIAAGCLAVLAVVLTLRSRRRHLHLKRRFNPYVAGGPVFAEDLFFGRQPILRRVLQTVHNNSLLLHGERRIGKTSLLHRIRIQLESLEDPEYRFYPAYIDLQGIAEERFFATLGEAVLDSLIPILGEEVCRPKVPLDEGYGHHHLQSDLRRLIRALQRETDRRVKIVLLIDEVDELNGYDPRVNQRLRSLFMKSFAESLTAVVAGVKIRRQWDREGSPWYNFFEEIAVQPLATEEARRLVTQPIQGVIRWQPGVPERILEATDCKPYLIQKMCLALISHVHEEQRTAVSLEDFEALMQAEEAR